MSGGGGNITIPSNPYEGTMANIAQSLWTQGKPTRKNLIHQYNKFTSGRLDAQDLPMFKPTFALGKQGLEDQFSLARQNVLGSAPAGGALTGALGDLEGQRATAVGSLPAQISQSLITDLQNKAYGAAFGTPSTAMQGLGSAASSFGSRTGMQAALDYQQQAASNAAMGALGQGLGGLFMNMSTCCFIFIESTTGRRMDPVVRRYRDEHMTVRNRRGYCWLADRIVPLMRRHKIVYGAVKKLMVDPMTSYGRWHYGQGKIGFIFYPLTALWLKVFDLLGSHAPYTRTGGEVV